MVPGRLRDPTSCSNCYDRGVTCEWNDFYKSSRVRSCDVCRKNKAGRCIGANMDYVDRVATERGWRQPGSQKAREVESEEPTEIPEKRRKSADADEDTRMATPSPERPGKSTAYVEISTPRDLSSWNVGPGITGIGSSPGWAGVQPSQGVSAQSPSDRSRSSSVQVISQPPVTPRPSSASIVTRSLFIEPENVASASQAVNPMSSLGAPFTRKFHRYIFLGVIDYHETFSSTKCGVPCEYRTVIPRMVLEGSSDQARNKPEVRMA